MNDRSQARPAATPALRAPNARLLLAPLALVWALAFSFAPARAQSDSTSAILRFTPTGGDSLGAGEEPLETSFLENDEEEWLQAPFGERLLIDPARWRSEDRGRHNEDLLLDYNRVDQLRLGVGHQWQITRSMYPRVGGRLEYSFGRERTLYGFQIEQPLRPPGRIAVGASFVRRTDHLDLQQTEDFENTLAMLFGRQDWRDYFEREGLGAYLSWRVPDFSTVSVHVRSDDYRSLELRRGTRSWTNAGRTLRENPAVDDGRIRAFQLRLERLVHRTRGTRAGVYHWIEFERGGAGLGGDFDYTRALADLRTVFRLSPATTFSVRAVAGTNGSGTLPRQREFVAGGVDGLRAHAFSEFRGNQLALAQAEYALSLWPYVGRSSDPGIELLAFVDVGRAWNNPDARWDVERQRLVTDGGFGIATAEDHLRLYFARDLRSSDGDFLVSLRLQRPF